MRVSGATRLLQGLLKFENVFYEYRFGISTRGLSGFTPGDWSHREHIYYGTIPYRGIFRILDSLALQRSDVIVDLGCGKGRILCCALLYHVARVVGVEDAEELVTIARKNLQKMGSRETPTVVVHGKAEDFDYSQGTIFYMFHPFGPITMRSVLSRIHSRLQQNPRVLRIVYVNPRHDSVLEATEWLERYERWPALQCTRYPVSFWRSRPTIVAR